LLNDQFEHFGGDGRIRRGNGIKRVFEMRQILLSCMKVQNTNFKI